MTIIFGTGYIASQLIYYENELEIKFFIDNDIKKIGKNFWGYDIKTPKAIIGREYDYIVLTSKQYETEMKTQLLELGVEKNKIINAWDLEIYKEENFNTDFIESNVPLHNIKIRNRQEYEQIQFDSLLLEMEEVITNMVLKAPKKRIYYPGKCQVCKKSVNLLIDDQYSGASKKVDFRERLVCPFCGLNNRQRQMARVVLNEVPTSSTLYLTEQITDTYYCLKKYYNNLIGSEYLGEEILGGTINEKGIRHEDLMKLSFDDETLDSIVSNDVFEHVADINKALTEIYRVLKQNGKLYATFPMNFSQEKTIKRAELTDKGIRYLLEPVYHGNPVSEDGSLVFYDYGWDFVNMVKNVGFKDVYFVPFYSIPYGNIGANSLFIFIARK